MRLIDDNGKLFGKINVIDFLVLLFLLFLLPTFYFGYKIFTKKAPAPAPTPKEFVEIEIPCVFIKLDPQTLNMIKIGDQQFELDGQKIGEIMSVGEPRPYFHKFNIGTDEMGIQRNISIEDKNAKELPVALKLKAEARNNSLYHDGRPITSDSIFAFKTDKYLVLVKLAMPAPILKERWFTAKLRFPGVSPEVLSSIMEGNVEKDDSGIVVGRLLRILSRKSSEIQVVKMEENRMVLVSEPYRNDIEVSADLLCIQRGAVWYYKGSYPIKIGSQIIFSSDFFIVSGVIIGIESIESIGGSN